MTEYITKEQAINIVNVAFGHIYDIDSETVSLTDLEIEIVMTIEQYTEAADVVPVVHAENLANAHPSKEFKCSKCGTHLADYVGLSKVDGVDDFYIFEFTDWNFCPKCGAAMFLDNVIVKE